MNSSKCSRAAAAALLLAFSGVPAAPAKQPVAASKQAGTTTAPSAQAAAAPTPMVWQNQVVYETVYDTECVLVPTTQMRTEYKTECKTETVPVTRTVYDEVTSTEMQTRYRTDYKTQTTPVTRTVIDQIPTTQMQTRFKTEYKTDSVPVTRTVVDHVPTTQMQTRYRTDYKTRTVPVTRYVPEVVYEPRTYTVFVPKQQMVNQQVWKTVLEPVTRTEKQYRYSTVMKTVPKTEYLPKTVSFTTSRVESSLVPESYSESVPVTRYRCVVEQQGSYQNVCVPVYSFVPATTCGLHGAGCSGGCGATSCRGGHSSCRGCTVRTSYAVQQVYVSRPVSKQVAETCYVQQTRTRMVSVQKVVQVPETRHRDGARHGQRAGSRTESRYSRRTSDGDGAEAGE